MLKWEEAVTQGVSKTEGRQQYNINITFQSATKEDNMFHTISQWHGLFSGEDLGSR